MTDTTAPTEPEFEPIQVSLLTGFLGSGKTTLLNKLVKHPDMVETAVLINEFGEIGLDHELLFPHMHSCKTFDLSTLCF